MMDVALSEQAPTERAAEADRLDWLKRHCIANRFLPVPPPTLHDVGDGDFRAIGAEFLGHFVTLGGLAPGHAVLDIGCGTGRMAIPLTQYLDPDRGSYAGFDVVAAGVHWCRDTVTPLYPNFSFRHIDLANGVYNPKGRQAVAETHLPYADGAYDFILATSVFTHLLLVDVARYFQEIARLCRPHGRLFATFFLLNERSRTALAATPGRLSIDPRAAGPDVPANPESPCSAMAQNEDWILETAAANGLRLAAPIAYGFWSGRAGLSFQDICVFERAEDSGRD